MKTVISLDNIKAKKFFLEESNYCNVDLPKYFKPGNLLRKISLYLDDHPNLPYHSNISAKMSPKSRDSEHVNYKLLGNKDGELGWRRYELIHPVLYVDLVNLMTTEENWKIICDRFVEFKKTGVICASIPIARTSKKSHKAEQVLTWWEEIEQEALKLGLDYNYVYDADISDCYGSIYTHSIGWAIHGRNESRKDKDSKKLLGSKIDLCIQGMQYRQSNGIPQGSTLSDFISEIVLGYVDELLVQKMVDMPKNEYKILRFRDDYKIFTNRSDYGKKILKLLSETLMELGLRLNSSKTKEGFDPIIASIKEDKIDELFIPLKHVNFSKWLMLIYSTTSKHPNSGKTARQLNVYHEALEERAKQKDKLKKYENPEVMISITTNLAIKNPKYYNWCAAIISLLLSYCPKLNRKSISERIVKKFKNIPNTALLDIWLQRVTFKNTPNETYNEKICNLVSIDSYPGNQSIWNSEWIEGELFDIVNRTRIISKSELKKLKPIIGRDETDLFRNIYDI